MDINGIVVETVMTKHLCVLVDMYELEETLVALAEIGFTVTKIDAPPKKWFKIRNIDNWEQKLMLHVGRYDPEVYEEYRDQLVANYDVFIMQHTYTMVQDR